MDTVHVVFRLRVLADLAVQVPDAQETVGDIIGIVEGILAGEVRAAVQGAVEIIDGAAHPGRFLIPVLAVEAVAVVIFGAEPFHLLLQGLQPLAQLHVLPLQLLAGLAVLGPRRGLGREEEEQGR